MLGVESSTQYWLNRSGQPAKIPAQSAAGVLLLEHACLPAHRAAGRVVRQLQQSHWQIIPSAPLAICVRDPYHRRLGVKADDDGRWRAISKAQQLRDVVACLCNVARKPAG